MAMLGASCSPCCGPKTCDTAAMNSTLAALRPSMTLAGTFPLPASIGALSFPVLDFGSSIDYVVGSRRGGSPPYSGASAYWQGYKSYSGEMIGTHELTLYPPNSSTGRYAFRTAYSDGRLVEVVFTNYGSDRFYAPNEANLWSEDNPCYVAVQIKLEWMTPLYQTVNKLPITYSTQTFSVTGGTYTVALLADADYINWYNSYLEGDPIYTTSDLGNVLQLASRFPGVAPDSVATTDVCAKNANIESFNVAIVPDQFFANTVAFDHGYKFATASRAYWYQDGSIGITHRRSGSWFPRRQADTVGPWTTSTSRFHPLSSTDGWTTRPTLAFEDVPAEFVQQTWKRISMSATRIPKIGEIETPYNATATLSLS